MRNKSMFWVCFWSVLFALGAVGLPLSIYYKQKSESEESTEDIKTHQKTLAEDIRSEVRKLGLSDDELWRKYPFGYIVYGGRDRSRVVLPLFNRGDIHPDADWKSTTITLDPVKKRFDVTIAKPLWKSPDGSLAFSGGPNVGVAAIIQHGSYTLGKPVLASVIFPQHPNIYLEVIDDKPNHQICVIGFKNLSHDDLQADGQPYGGSL
jgi:hypothetical protein